MRGVAARGGLWFVRQMLQILAIGVGGFVGALARYGGVRLVHRFTGDAFPVGTLTVNFIGSFALGLILAYAATRPMDPDLRAGLAVGFCGAFTTMSAFGFETLSLIERGAFGLAAINAVASVGLCLLAVWLGMTVARGW